VRASDNLNSVHALQSSVAGSVVASPDHVFIGESPTSIFLKAVPTRYLDERPAGTLDNIGLDLQFDPLTHVLLGSLARDEELRSTLGVIFDIAFAIQLPQDIKFSQTTTLMQWLAVGTSIIVACLGLGSTALSWFGYSKTALGLVKKAHEHVRGHNEDCEEHCEEVHVEICSMDHETSAEGQQHHSQVGNGSRPAFPGIALIPAATLAPSARPGARPAPLGQLPPIAFQSATATAALSQVQRPAPRR